MATITTTKIGLSTRARYDNYRIYMVEFGNEEQVKVFQCLEKVSDSLQFIGHAREVNQKLSILVAAHKIAEFEDFLAHYNTKYRILTYNFQEKIDASYLAVRPIDTDLEQFDWHHYYHLETIYDWLESLTHKYADRVTLLDIGTSTFGVPIKGIKISQNAKNKAIFIEAGIHAREWIAPAAATFIIHTLLISSDKTIQELTQRYNWIIFPSVNPDGYKFTFEKDRMWRKNCQLFYTCRGVDLNRNYPEHWNTTGSSSEPFRFDYAGPSEASEVETKRIIRFLTDNVKEEQIRTYISLHSYSQMIMFPYGHTGTRVKNYNDLKEFGDKAVEAIHKLTGTKYICGSSFETIYPTSGSSVDWAYDKLDIPIAYTFELRGSPDSHNMFLLPFEEILPTAQEAFVAIRIIIESAMEKGYYK